jgi:CzcA family heavy metal efflux pump
MGSNFRTFTRFLASQWRAVCVIFFLIAVAGYLALINLPSDVYPELQFPRIVVIADCGLTSPERLLLSTTRLLEEACAQVWRVRWVRSKTIRGSAELSVEFQPGTDMIYALQQVQAKIGEIRNELPANTGLVIERVTPAIFPVLTYNVSSDTLTQADLYTIARYQIQPRLTRATGVARVLIQGGDIAQYEIQIDPEKLKSYHLSLEQIADALQKTNQIQVVGKLNQNYQQNLVIATGEAQQASDFDNLVVATRQAGAPVFLKDVGHATLGYADRTRLVNVDGKRGIVLSVFRQPSANVVAVSKNVKDELGQIMNTLPPGVNIGPSYDESQLVTQAMDSVRDAILLGVAMIIIVLFLFLREWKSTIIAAISIPLSALASFGILYLMGQNLNLMSLGGLAVAIGLVIDDAIVVIENIDRQLGLGLAIQDAVAQAMSELTGPVVSSTATTVVVFLPLGLLSGVAGQFFTSLTVTLSAAVIFSLIIALTLTPVLSSIFLTKVKKGKKETHGFLERTYKRVLQKTLARPAMLGIISLLLVVIGIFVFNHIGTDFLPVIDEGAFMLDYLTPPGTSLEQTDATANKLEAMLAKSSDIASWTRRTGTENGLFATLPNKGDILVTLKPQGQRRSIFSIMEDERKTVEKEIPEADVDFHQILQDQLNDLSGAEAPINLRIFGQDPTVLKSLANQVEDKLGDVKGVVDVVNSSRESAPEIDLRVDPVRSGRLGLGPTDVANQVQDAMLGRIATQVRQQDRLIDVRLRFPDLVRNDPNQLAEVPVVGQGGEVLPLSAIAEIKQQQGELRIERENQRRYVTVKANLENRDLGSAIKNIQAKLAQITVPQGFQLSVAGLYVNQQQAFSELLAVLLFATTLVYVLLLIQFRSFLQPLAILAAIPLALLGVVVALWLTKTSLNVSSFMGIILLVGLVVKNGIIMLDYVNRLRAQGLGLDEALVEAGSVRLRPILMTTLCTVLGLFPLAIGLGADSELQRPLAIAVIGGLSLSTLFTLFFVPSIYRLLQRLASRHNLPGKSNKAAATVKTRTAD